MEAKRTIIRLYVSQGLRLNTALALAKLSRSTYYYRASYKKKGKACSQTTEQNGQWVDNEQVVHQIKAILEPDFIDYGYKRTTEALKERGFKIGKAKVYRLMKENGLLHPPKKASKSVSTFTVFSTPQPDRPFHILEIDIKYIYIQGERRNSYLITILDTFHRQAYTWGLFPNMKTDRIVELMLQLSDQYLIPRNIDPQILDVVIRTDHGSQFLSLKYIDLLGHLKIQRNYIAVATPQLNGHIEGFHSTVQRLVCNHYYFQTLSEAKKVFERFFHTYNHDRIMASILYKRPVQFLNLWDQGKIGYLKVSGKNKFFFKEEGPSQDAPSSPKIC